MYQKSLIAILLLLNICFHGRAQIQWKTYPQQLSEELKDRVKYGFLTVPENYEEEASRDIFMAFAILKSSSNNPLPDPQIIIPGGPGFGATSTINRVYGAKETKKILEKRDIVLIDPRGCGYSHPKLCANLNNGDYLLNNSLLDGEALEAYRRKMMQSCADSIAISAADIHSYHSINIAHDIERLRQTLGYEKWNIKGHSYGSYHGFVLMQTFPETVNSAILSGVIFDFHEDLPHINVAKSLSGVFHACENDPNCNQAYPNLEEVFYQVIEKVAENPIEIKMNSSKTSDSESYLIKPLIVVLGLQQILSAKQGMEFVPAFLNALDNENTWILKNLASAILGGVTNDRDMYLMITQNDFDFSKERTIPNTQTQLMKFIEPILTPTYQADNRQFQLLSTETKRIASKWDTLSIPTIFISGDLDPITPSSRVPLMQSYLPNSDHLVVSNSGHDCTRYVDVDFATFFDKLNPKVAIAESIKKTNTFNFVTKVSLNRGISTLLSDVVRQKYGRVIMLASSLLLCLIAFFYFSFTFLINLISKRSSNIDTSPLALLSFSVPIIISFLLLLAIRSTININPLILAMGLAGDEWGFIKFLAIGLIFLLIFLFLRFKHINKSKSKRTRILVLLGCVGATGFVLSMLLSGFFF